MKTLLINVTDGDKFMEALNQFGSTDIELLEDTYIIEERYFTVITSGDADELCEFLTTKFKKISIH